MVVERGELCCLYVITQRAVQPAVVGPLPVTALPLSRLGRRQGLRWPFESPAAGAPAEILDQILERTYGVP